MREKKKASKLDAKPLTRFFIAALARRISQLDAATISQLAQQMIAPAREELDKERLKFRTERDKYPFGLLDKYNSLKADVEKLEAAFGFKITSRWEGVDGLVKAAELVRRCGITETYNGIVGLRNTLKADLERIDGALALFNPEGKASQEKPERLSMHTPGCITNTSAGDCNCGYDQQN